MALITIYAINSYPPLPPHDHVQELLELIQDDREWDSWTGQVHHGYGTYIKNLLRYCANMTGGTAYIYGTVHHMIPTFRFRETGIIGPDKLQMAVFEGDIANRGKGTLFIKAYTRY